MAGKTVVSAQVSSRTLEYIDELLFEDENRSSFLRGAIDRELRRRLGMYAWQDLHADHEEGLDTGGSTGL